jgi:hypothetical protein
MNPPSSSAEALVWSREAGHAGGRRAGDGGERGDHHGSEGVDLHLPPGIGTCRLET